MHVSHSNLTCPNELEEASSLLKMMLKTQNTFLSRKQGCSYVKWKPVGAVSNVILPYLKCLFELIVGVTYGKCLGFMMVINLHGDSDLEYVIWLDCELSPDSREPLCLD
jgi:hypothetical protein